MAGVCKKPKAVVSNPKSQELFSDFKHGVKFFQVDFKSFMMKFQGMAYKWICEEVITTSVTDFCT